MADKTKSASAARASLPRDFFHNVKKHPEIPPENPAKPPRGSPASPQHQPALPNRPAPGRPPFRPGRFRRQGENAKAATAHFRRPRAAPSPTPAGACRAGPPSGRRRFLDLRHRTVNTLRANQAAILARLTGPIHGIRPWPWRGLAFGRQSCCAPMAHDNPDSRLKNDPKELDSVCIYYLTSPRVITMIPNRVHNMFDGCPLDAAPAQSGVGVGGFLFLPGACGGHRPESIRERPLAPPTSGQALRSHSARVRPRGPQEGK